MLNALSLSGGLGGRILARVDVQSGGVVEQALRCHLDECVQLFLQIVFLRIMLQFYCLRILPALVFKGFQGLRFGNGKDSIVRLARFFVCQKERVSC